ncbi:DUF2510 domain-containing protein [Microcella sp.]|uniref:DUF2510 domain-containing protein n=1 Tax=Microcella sp. TaxID=1913979 RepID=UPI003F6F3E36
MSTPAAGWYTDPDDTALIRWWDGTAWTGNTQPNPAAAPPPVPAAAADPVPVVTAPPVSAAPPVTAAPPPAPLAPAPLTPAPLSSAPLSSAPYVPPPFADPPPASPATTPGPRRSGSMPISEPVRLVPPTSGSIPVTGFPGFDDAPPPSVSGLPPLAVPSATPAPLAVPSAVATPAPLAVPGALATAVPLPASATTPWTSSATFAQPTSAADLASVDYEPMTRSWGSARGSSAARVVTGVTTGGAWMLALSPLLQLGLVALTWWLTDGGASSATPVVASGFALVGLLWVVLAAILDYRRLGALGHEFRPSVAWIIAGPFFYLMARGIHVYRTTRSGTGPTWVYVVTALLVGAALSLSSFALPRAVSLTELRAVETQIATDLRAQGINYSVICPSQVPGSLGSSFVCTAYDEVGPAALLRVTWSGVPGSFTYEIESTAT